jgi:hypothetical protein
MLIVPWKADFFPSFWQIVFTKWPKLVIKRSRRSFRYQIVRANVTRKYIATLSSQIFLENLTRMIEVQNLGIKLGHGIFYF